MVADLRELRDELPLAWRIARMRLRAEGNWRRAAGVDEEHRAARLHALVAGIMGARRRCAKRLVIGDQRCHQPAGGGGDAVEMRKGAVAMTEEAKHRHHPVDVVQQPLGRHEPACDQRLPERQQVDEESDQGGRIARDVTAVGQDLRL